MKPPCRTHRHTCTLRTYTYIHTSCDDTIRLEQRGRKSRCQSTLTWHPGGASRFMSVVRATLQGVFQVSLMMGKVTSPPPHHCIPEYGEFQVVTLPCSPAFSNHVGETKKRQRVPWLAGWSGDRHLLQTWGIRAFFPPPIAVINFTRITVRESERPRSRHHRRRPGGLTTVLLNLLLSRLLAAITDASACLSVRQPARQTAWRMRADKRPIRQVIARVFFKS